VGIAINRQFESCSADGIEVARSAGVSDGRHGGRGDIGHACGLRSRWHRRYEKQSAKRNRRSRTGSAEPLHRRVPSTPVDCVATA
jgi:hypothetical protein